MNSRSLFLENWKGKVTSLLISIAIWYLIKSHLESDKPSFPVPGTDAPVPTRASGPNLDDTLLSPLAPPVPGADDLN